MIAAGPHPDGRAVPATADEGWLWPHFSPRELSCRCGKYCAGEYFHSPMLLDALEALRVQAGRALKINSGRRCAQHNAAVGGAPLSQHKLAIAADVSLGGHDPVALSRAALACGFRGFGFGRTFLHLDMRERRAAFHYPGGRAAWTGRFGFDPVQRFRQTGGFDG